MLLALLSAYTFLALTLAYICMSSQPQFSLQIWSIQSQANISLQILSFPMHLHLNVLLLLARVMSPLPLCCFSFFTVDPQLVQLFLRDIFLLSLIYYSWWFCIFGVVPLSKCSSEKQTRTGLSCICSLPFFKLGTSLDKNKPPKMSTLQILSPVQQSFCLCSWRHNFILY